MLPIEKRQEVLIIALEKTLGVVVSACNQAGISRTQHYDWMKKYPKYKKRVDEINSIALDFVEGKMFELINGVTLGKMVDGEMQVYSVPPNVSAAIYYLKTKGKHRGYNERIDIGLGIKEIPAPKINFVNNNENENDEIKTIQGDENISE